MQQWNTEHTTNQGSQPGRWKGARGVIDPGQLCGSQTKNGHWQSKNGHWFWASSQPLQQLDSAHFHQSDDRIGPSFTELRVTLNDYYFLSAPNNKHRKWSMFAWKQTHEYSVLVMCFCTWFYISLSHCWFISVEENVHRLCMGLKPVYSADIFMESLFSVCGKKMKKEWAHGKKPSAFFFITESITTFLNPFLTGAARYDPSRCTLIKGKEEKQAHWCTLGHHEIGIANLLWQWNYLYYSKCPYYR